MSIFFLTALKRHSQLLSLNFETNGLETKRPYITVACFMQQCRAVTNSGKEKKKKRQCWHDYPSLEALLPNHWHSPECQCSDLWKPSEDAGLLPVADICFSLSHLSLPHLSWRDASQRHPSRTQFKRVLDRFSSSLSSSVMDSDRSHNPSDTDYRHRAVFFSHKNPYSLELPGWWTFNEGGLVGAMYRRYLTQDV